MTMMRLFLIIAVALLLTCSNAFSPRSMAAIPRTAIGGPRSSFILFNNNGENNNVDTEAAETEAPPTQVLSSLEEKMKGWEASEEEIKAATLGGIVPRSDAFDVGLYIAFPLMVISGLLFAFFPLIMGNIDTSSVGAPPTSL
jgi:hypothetical protein